MGRLLLDGGSVRAVKSGCSRSSYTLRNLNRYDYKKKIFFKEKPARENSIPYHPLPTNPCPAPIFFKSRI
jgi:hypothetical protein